MSDITVNVNTHSFYRVHIGNGLLERSGAKIAELMSPCRLAVVTDSTVAPLYLNKVTDSLTQAGFRVTSYVFPSGEKSKNLDTFGAVLAFFADSSLTRSDCAVALGGGVVGDITGFAAGCYMRGIPFVQLSTTLLSCVDASVGGKTAVDLPSGKNLAGLFHQPALVLCDTDCLNTLDKANYSCGMAEAIKTGVLVGHELFDLFKAKDCTPAIAEIIARCVAYKSKIVESDENDTSERMLLNLGHTVGHAVESLSSYTILHGQAVSIGLAVMCRAAERLYGATDCREIIDTLKRHSLPTETGYSPERIVNAALSDKKRSGDGITIVIPHGIGSCSLKAISFNELIKFVSAGLGV